MSTKYNLRDIVHEKGYAKEDALKEAIFEYLLTLEYQVDDKKIETTQREGELTVVNVDESTAKIPQTKMHFSGMDDSNQSRYEVLSNEHKICTISTNETVGKVLHTFLRMIIDENVPFFGHVLDEKLWDDKEEEDSDIEDANKEYTLKEIVDHMADYNKMFHSSYDLNGREYLENKLRGFHSETRIKRRVDLIDKWDIYRIGTALGIWDYNRKYEDIPI